MNYTRIFNLIRLRIRTSKPYSYSPGVRRILSATTAVALAASLMLVPNTVFAARTVNLITVGGGSSVTVAPSATIAVGVTVVTTGTNGNDPKWESTFWEISTDGNGTETCVDHSDVGVAGTYTQSFNVAAPEVEGTYNLYIGASHQDNCGGGSNIGRGQLLASVIVSAPTEPEEEEEPLVTVTVIKYLDGQHADAETAQEAAFPISSSWEAENLGDGNTTFTLDETGLNNENAYEATSAEMTAGASYNLSETIGELVGESCEDQTPYALVGYTVGDSPEDAADKEPGIGDNNGLSLENITSNQYVIVWNRSCEPEQDDDEDLARITIVKNTNLIQGQEGPEFPFSLSGSDEYSQTFTLESGQSVTYEVEPGQYTLTEGADLSGWTLAGSSCEYDGEEAGSVVARGHQLTLEDAGDEVICTFTNNVELTVVNVLPDSVGPYSVSISWKTNHGSTSRLVYDTISRGPAAVGPCPAPNSLLECYGYAFTTSESDNIFPYTVTHHTVTVTGLQLGQTYYLRPVSHGSPEVLGAEVSVTTFTTSGTGGTGGGTGGGAEGGTGGGTAPISAPSPATNAPDGRVLGDVTAAPSDPPSAPTGNVLAATTRLPRTGTPIGNMLLIMLSMLAIVALPKLATDEPGRSRQ